MKRTFILLAACGLVGTATLAGAASAQPASHRVGPFVAVQYDQRQSERQATIDDREARLRTRIEHGMRDGGITREEGRRLFRDLDGIHRKERAFRADGRLDRREFDELNADLDRLGMRVRHERWDEQRR